jgi:hypothetical protein
MSLESALARFRTRVVDTPDTPGYAVGVSAKAAPLLVCTPVTSDTPKNRKQGCEAGAASEFAPPLHLSADDRQAIEEAIEERAAIREFDGGQTRDVAEREARTAMRVYRYRLADSPDTWLVMIAPGCNLAEARGALNLQFGPDRVLELVEHTPRRTAN